MEEELKQEGQEVQKQYEDQDMGESNYFSEPRFDSVLDRYYTRYYKRITPALISTMLDMKEDKVVLTEV